MTDYIENDGERDSPINVYIGEEEWRDYSFQNKVRLLYRLRQSDIPLAHMMAEPLSQVMDQEEKNRRVDVEATIERNRDVKKWQD